MYKILTPYIYEKYANVFRFTMWHIKSYNTINSHLSKRAICLESKISYLKLITFLYSGQEFLKPYNTPITRHHLKLCVHKKREVKKNYRSNRNDLKRHRCLHHFIFRYAILANWMFMTTVENGYSRTFSNSLLPDSTLFFLRCMAELSKSEKTLSGIRNFISGGGN